MAGEMQLALSREVAIDLEMNFGAVRADIDLVGIPLTRLEIETGASQTLIDISEPNSEVMSRPASTLEPPTSPLGIWET